MKPMATPDSIFQRQHDLLAETLPGRVLVAGAGGIGHALCEAVIALNPAIELIRLSRSPAALPPLGASHRDLALDYTLPSSIDAAIASLAETGPPDWVLIATGWLHDEQRQPEKRLAELDAAHLLHSYQLNAVGPALLVRALDDGLPRRHPVRFGVLSARVGSISDNRLGGWHSYRASKAALNMLLKNMAIEWDRARKPRIVVGLQPGTTDTALSAPFQRNLAAGQLQSPAFTAERLVRVMRNLEPGDSGRLFDFEGLCFEP